MGNAVFPALPGLKWGAKKTPVWSTNIQKSANGRELRAAYYSYPQWRFSLSFEVLRTKAAINEGQSSVRGRSCRYAAYPPSLLHSL